MAAQDSIYQEFCNKR